MLTLSLVIFKTNKQKKKIMRFSRPLYLENEEEHFQLLMEKQNLSFNADSAHKTCLSQTHLQIPDGSRRGAGPDLLHQTGYQVVGLKAFVGKLLSALRAGHRTPHGLPVRHDASPAEVMHAAQHHGLFEELKADGTCQIFSETRLTPAGRHLEQISCRLFHFHFWHSSCNNENKA